MASISDDGGGLKRIRFTAQDGTRKTVRLCKGASMSDADEVRALIERILADRRLGNPHAAATCKRLTDIRDNDPKLWKRMERVGLVEPAARRTDATLADVLGEFLGTITIKQNTRNNYEQTGRVLKTFFGETKAVRAVTPLDADRWRQWMKADGLAEATISRRVKTARQIWKRAGRWGMVDSNPFLDVKAGPQTNKSRLFFVTRDVAQRVFDTCPDTEWRLIFALSRFGGLRCPSEHLLLKWSDVNWERGRMLITSPKTEHHEGGDARWCPIYPELRPYLLAAFTEAAEGAVYAIARQRLPSCNLRTQLQRIIKRAGLTPWPRLFHNLRATRQTELEEVYPSHVVCAWFGNSARIARDHYLQVTDGHFEKAAQIPAPQPAHTGSNLGKPRQVKDDEIAVIAGFPASCAEKRYEIVPPAGTEHPEESPKKPRSSNRLAQKPAHGGDVTELARLLADLPAAERARLLASLKTR